MSIGFNIYTVIKEISILGFNGVENIVFHVDAHKQYTGYGEIHFSDTEEGLRFIRDVPFLNIISIQLRIYGVVIGSLQAEDDS
jgi:hypothetical protein